MTQEFVEVNIAPDHDNVVDDEQSLTKRCYFVKMLIIVRPGIYTSMVQYKGTAINTILLHRYKDFKQMNKSKKLKMAG